MNELVSVVVPVYKVEGLLGRCLDSLLDQSYRNLDIILIDDGSPDRCGALCDEYAARDARVSVLHQANLGLSAARNAGLTRAVGEFVTLVDSDDWLDPRCIEELHRLATAHDSDIAVCGYRKSGLSEEEAGAEQPDRSRVLSNVEALAELLSPRYINMVVAWGKLYRRALFDGITFPVDRFHEDEFTTHQLLWRARRVVVTDARLYHYWQRADSITATRSPDVRRDSRDGFRARAAFLNSVGLADQAGLTARSAFAKWRRDRRRFRAAGLSPEVRHLDAELREFADEARRYPMPPLARARFEVLAAVPRLESADSFLVERVRSLLSHG